MNTNEVLGWFVLAAPVLAGLGGLVGAMLVKNWRPARDGAIAGADYVQALDDAVRFAEHLGVTKRLPGVEKFANAVKQMDDWLDAQGIHGDAKRLTLERVKADIELARARLFPKAPAA